MENLVACIISSVTAVIVACVANVGIYLNAKKDRDNLKKSNDLFSKNICRYVINSIAKDLLSEDHIITNEEFNEFTETFNLYESQGGNGSGKAHYLKVKEKYLNQIDKHIC